jgi:hypothetical protein
LVPAAFAVVSTHQSAIGVVGYGPFFLCAIHKEGLCPSSGGINRLMMMIIALFYLCNFATLNAQLNKTFLSFFLLSFNGDNNRHIMMYRDQKKNYITRIFLILKGD